MMNIICPLAIGPADRKLSGCNEEGISCPQASFLCHAISDIKRNDITSFNRKILISVWKC